VRTSILALCLVLLASSPALAGYVIHDGAPGIVAFDNDRVCLDSNGHVWNLNNGSGWERWEEHDPPMPLDEILFWGYRCVITIHNEFWYLGAEWTNFGFWPDLPASIEGESELAPGAAVSPNPTPGRCSVTFSVRSEGTISATVLDVSGRIVRHLLDGPHPAGEYRLEWDGTDDNGRELPAGVYLTRIETGEGVTNGRIILAR